MLYHIALLLTQQHSRIPKVSTMLPPLGTGLLDSALTSLSGCIVSMACHSSNTRVSVTLLRGALFRTSLLLLTPLSSLLR